MVIFPHGETNVTLACQNRCVSCNHFIPVQSPWFVKPETLERDLNTAAKIVHFNVYNLVGGEPTLHPHILDLLDIVNASGISSRTEITSNGQGAQRWSDDFYRKIDDLIITPYKLSSDERQHITNKCADFGVSLEWHPVIFTWAGYKQEQSAESAAELYRDCWYRRNRNVIDEGYFYRCCIGRFTPSILMGLEKEHDGILLDGLTEEALINYLGQEETPDACLKCAGNRGARIPWREQTDPAKWIEESLG